MVEIKTTEELDKMTDTELEEYADSVYNYYDGVIAVLNKREENRIDGNEDPINVLAIEHRKREDIIRKRIENAK